MGVAMGGASITIHEGDRRTSSSISQKRSVNILVKPVIYTSYIVSVV